jgi:hypothetical protein
MNKYLRKNGKKIMAVLGVLLMVAFALPTATSQMRNRGSGVYGSLYDGKADLSARDEQMLRNELVYLKQHLSPQVLAIALGAGGQMANPNFHGELLGDPMAPLGIQNIIRQSQQNPFLAMQSPLIRAYQYGQYILAQMDDNEDMFPLLVAEARANGTTVNNDVIQEVLTRRGLSPETDNDEYESMRTSLRDLLMVINSYQRAANVVKVSQPAREHRMASQMQEMSVNLVEFSAKDYLSQVGEPTPDQVKQQFEKYKNVVADGSPSGFGYKYPNRVKFDAVVLDREQLKKAIGDVDLVDMLEYYERNKNKPEMIVTTQPASRPSSEFSLNPVPATTRPTTRPKTWDEAKEQIKNTLTDQRISELSNKVRDAVRNTMVNDYNAWKAAQASAKQGTSQPAPASSLGPPYNSFEYLQALRNKIQKDFKVDLTIERRDQWQSASSLKDTDFAKLSWDPQNAAPIDFSQMLTARLESFLGEDARRQSGAARVLAMWEPTPLFTNELLTQTVVARATAADPTHAPASLDEVKDKVVADTRLAMAYEKAKQSAQAMVDAAKSGKWLQSVANEQNRKTITTGSFSAQDSGFFAAMPVQGYDLKGTALAAFKSGAFKLLAQPERPGGTVPRPVNPITPATTRAATKTAASQPAPIPSSFKDHPVGLVELPADGKVLAVEVNSLKAGPGWTKENQASLELRMMLQQQTGEELQLRSQWFNYDNLITRTRFKAKEQRDRSNTPKRPALPPVDNPFLGQALP